MLLAQFEGSLPLAWRLFVLIIYTVGLKDKYLRYKIDESQGFRLN